jgi:hypothetical protein
VYLSEWDPRFLLTSDVTGGISAYLSEWDPGLTKLEAYLLGFLSQILTPRSVGFH